MNCKLNYLYEKFPDNPEFAQHLEQIELSIWKTFKDEKFPTFEYEGKRYYSISPKMSKERKKQMKILQSLRDKYNSPNLFLTKRLYPFDYDLITIRMGTIVSSQKELFDVLQKNKPKKPPEEKEAYPSIYEETYEKFLRFNSNTSNPQSSENKNINNQQKNVVYSAIFFNTNELTNKYNQVHPNLYSHHSTIEFKPQTIENLPVGENRNIRIIGRLTTDKVDVLIVDNPLSKNKFPHITLSTAEGVKPFESNSEIEKNQNKIKPLNDIIVGKVGYFDGKNEIVNDEKFDENYNLNKIKSGVEELFDSNPELANIGTAEQYSQYLDTIFPDSKVRDIVYKGGSENIDYVKDFDKIEKETSGSYYPDFSRKGLFFTNKKELAEKYGKVKSFIIDLSKASEYTTGDESSKIDVIESGKYGDKSRIIYWKKPKDKTLQKFTDLAEYIVFEPEQIHILGNKQDIEGFKKFVNQNQIEDNVFNKYSYIKNIENKINYQKLTEEEKNQTVAEAAKKAGSVNALHDLAARLADRIGGTVKFENIRNVDYKGYNQGNVSVINEAYADTSTVVHEILGHPIINAIRNVSDETEQFFSGKVENVQTLYKNLLKELEYGTGKEVLNRIKRDYSSGFKGIFGGVEISYFQENNKWYKTFDGKNKTETTKEEAEIRAKVNGEKLFTLEEQQEEAIVELLGMYTANKLDAVKDKGLIAILKKLLKEMTAYLRSLFNSKEIEIEKLDVSMTLDDLANLLAYTNSKLLLPNSTIEYTTPDNKKFKTYAEASKYISNLAKSVEDVDLDSINFKKAKTIEDVPVSFNSFIILDSKERSILDDDGILDIITDYFSEPLMVKKVKNNWYVSENYDSGYVLYLYDTDPNVKETLKHGILIPEEKVIELFNTRFENPEFERFIGKNKKYEQSKEIIEEWKKVNNIVYNPEEVYSRGQEFVSVVGAYSDFDVKLMMQNLLSHIEDNEKAGGKFAISVFTKRVDKTIGHLEGGGGKIKFKIFPKSEDILWAANRDVYSGSVWDAGEKINKYKKSELLGVSYTKYPSLGNVKSVQPNLADIIDDIQWGHNELGISLTGNNFRLEYDKDIPYTTKKIIDSVNSILDQKYGKLVKPEINKNQIGIQPKITNETLKVKISDIKYDKNIRRPKTFEELEEGDLYLYREENGKYFKEDLSSQKEIEITKEEYEGKKDYNSQALINTKIAALKEVAKKYPRSLIRSEVVSISEFNEVQYQKLPSQLDKNQSNQIEELKQSDPRWNKYSNEDIQRFIDSVFPESKVKEIVYHGTDSIFEKFDKYKFREGQQGNGLMFSGTITSIEKEKGNQVEGFYFLKEKTSNYGKIILPVLLNIKNPKDFGKNIETMFFGDINPTYEKLSFVTPEELKEYKKNNIDSLIGEVTGVGNEIVVFEPEQIYILNSEKAIADMEKFVGGKPTFNKELVQNIQKLFESNPELANAVYEALGFNNVITPDDKIIWGHPTIGKTTAKEQKGFLDFDTDFKPLVAQKLGLPKSQQNSLGLNEWRKTTGNEEAFNSAMREVWTLAKEQSKAQNKILMVSDMIFLRENQSDFDKIINIPSTTFINRAIQRGDNTEILQSWKNKIDSTLKNVDSKKIITTDKYLSDLFITPQQKQQAQQLYSQYLDTIFPDSKVKDIVYHGTNANIEFFDKSKVASNTLNYGFYGKGFYFNETKNDLINWWKTLYKKEPNIVTAIINTKNPYKEASNVIEEKTKLGNKQETEQFTNNLLQENYDSVLPQIPKEEGSNEFVVFEPEQIHILGSKKDVEGFKKFVNQNQIEDNVFINNIASYDENFEKYNKLFEDNSKNYFQLNSFVDIYDNTKKIERLVEEANLELNNRLMNYLKKYNITVKDIKEFENTNKIDAIGVTDILNKIIYIDKKRESLDTLPEEAAHMFTFLLKHTSEMDKMINSIDKWEGYSKVYNDYYSTYEGDIEKIKVEAVGKFIALHLIKQEPTVSKEIKENIFKILWKFVLQLFEYKNDLQQLNRYAKEIATKVFNNEMLLDINNNSDVALVDFKTALKNDFLATQIHNKMKNYFTLTGSAALSTQGTIYRKSKNLLHDLDYIASEGQLVENKIKELFPNSIKFHNGWRHGDYTTRSYIVPPLGISIINVNRENGNWVEEYDLIDKNLKVVGSYTSKIIDGVRKVRQIGIKALCIDVFDYDKSKSSETFLEFTNWDAIFKAKLEFAREKDIKDWVNFINYKYATLKNDQFLFYQKEENDDKKFEDNVSCFI